MPYEEYNSFATKVQTLTYAQQLDLLSIIVSQLQAHNRNYGNENLITKKLNEVYSKIPVEEQTLACGASMEVVREQTQNDSW